MIVNDTTRTTWLASLKEGDTVALRVHSYYSAPYELFKVTKRTPTQIVCAAALGGYEHRFNADDGSERGPNRYGQIEAATEGVHAAVELHQLRTWAKQRAEWSKATLEQLRAIKQILEGTPT